MERDEGSRAEDTPTQDGPERVWDPETGRYVDAGDLLGDAEEPTEDEPTTPPQPEPLTEPAPAEPLPVQPIPAPTEPTPTTTPSPVARATAPTWTVALLSAVIGAVVAIVAVVFLPDGDGQPSTPEDGAAIPLSTTEVVTGLRQVVVSVSGDEDAAGRRRSASGVVLSADGTIVTSARLVEGQEQLAVAFASGKLATATVVGTDPFWDLAFIDVRFEDLQALDRSTAEFVGFGDEIVAVSSPAQTYTSVGSGVVSSIGRPIEDANGDTRFDLLRVSGDAGGLGSLIANLGGEAVGITSSVRDAADGTGYVLPIDIVWAAFDRVVEQDADATHPWIGLVTTPIGPEAEVLGDARGLLSVLVFRDSPAAEAGMRPGDFVVAVDDQPAEGGLLLLSRLLEHGVGGEVEIAYMRGGDLTNVLVEIGEQPAARQGEEEES